MPDFRVVSQRNGVLQAPRDVRVISALDRMSSIATLQSESPILADTNAFIGDTIDIYLDEQQIFRGGVDKEIDTQTVEAGSTYTVELRSISRNVVDSFITNPLTVKEKFENVTLDKLFMRTLDLEGFATLNVAEGNIGRGVFDPSDEGFQSRVTSFKWFEADNIGAELRYVCSEYRCVFTDDHLGILHAYNYSDFASRDAQTIDTRQKRITRSFDHQRRYARYVGFAVGRTEKDKETQYLRGEFIESRENDRRWFAKIYRDALNSNDLEEAVRFDANRRRMNGLEMLITIPGLVYYEKGTPITLTYNANEIRRYPTRGWIINAVHWRKSVSDGSETMLTLAPIEQFNPNLQSSGTYEMVAYDPNPQDENEQG